MKDRFTVQIITPSGNMLGSFKFPSFLTNQVLNHIRNIFTERIFAYEMKVDDGLSVSEQETTMHTANKRNQAKVDQLKKQINWADENNEVL